MNNNDAYIITDSILNKISSIMQELGKLDKEKCKLLDRRVLERNIKASIALNDDIDKLMDSNCYKLYDYLERIEVIDEEVIKKSYSIISGKEPVYRSGLMGGKNIESLINNLLAWNNSVREKSHPIILAIVFYYWFMIIKPFNDYNGVIALSILGRKLCIFNSVFNNIAINECLANNKEEYNRLLNKGNTNDFIEFMLDIIYKALIGNKENEFNENTLNLNKLLNIMEVNKPMTAYEIMERLNIKSKETLRNSYLNFAIKEDLIRLTIPDKPTSRNQMYYKI